MSNDEAQENNSTTQTRSCGGLFHVALQAARDINAPMRQGGQILALTSIVFSVIALEAFLNEVADTTDRYKTDPLLGFLQSL